MRICAALRRASSSESRPGRRRHVRPLSILRRSALGSSVNERAWEPAGAQGRTADTAAGAAAGMVELILFGRDTGVTGYQADLSQMPHLPEQLVSSGLQWMWASERHAAPSPGSPVHGLPARCGWTRLDYAKTPHLAEWLAWCVAMVRRGGQLSFWMLRPMCRPGILRHTPCYSTKLGLVSPISTAGWSGRFIRAFLLALNYTDTARGDASARAVNER